MKPWSRALRTSDWAKGSPSNRTMTLSTQPTQEWLRDNSLNTYVNVIFQVFLLNKFAKMSKILFSLCHYGVLYVD